MKSMLRTLCLYRPWCALSLVLMLFACGQNEDLQNTANNQPADAENVPESLPMGGAKSVMSVFITSVGSGRGADLGGLAGADAHCQSLAQAEGAGDHTWRAYLSTRATETEPAVNARDRIGSGPWYNAEGRLMAANVEQLHTDQNRIGKETAVTEKFDVVGGAGETSNMHDILTGSRPDGTSFEGNEDLTCGNWRSSTTGRAQVGHHDRMGQGEMADSWNSAHASRGCSQQDLQSTGGAGLFYCFAID